MSCNGLKDVYDFLGFDKTSGGGVDIAVKGEFPINVAEIITSTKKEYTVSLIESANLLGSLVIGNIEITPDDVAYKSGVIPLKGVTVNEILRQWAFTKDGNAVDVTQTIDGVPVLPTTVKSDNKTGLSLVFDSIVADRTSTLFGDDELGLAGSTVTEQVVLEFGNRIWYGEAAFEDNDGLLATLLTNLDSEIRTDRFVTINPTSLSGSVYVYCAIPTDIHTDTIFEDLASPVDVDPLKVHKTGFTLSNGLTPDTYTVYISKQGALRDSIITPK